MHNTIETGLDDNGNLKKALVVAAVLHLLVLGVRVPMGEVLREVATKHEGIVLAPTPHLRPKPVERTLAPQRLEPQVLKVPVPEAPEPLVDRPMEPPPVPLLPDLAALVPIPDLPVPEPPPADSDGPIEVGGRVLPPTRLFAPLPTTPPIAARLGIEGNVVLEAVIDREGQLVGLQALSGLGFGLEEAALAAVRRWTFSPASLDNQPVAVRWRLVVSFRSTRR